MLSRAADERGTFVHQLEVTGLLIYYLAEHRGLRDPVVSVNNTSMATRLGRHWGMAVHETPVGFGSRRSGQRERIPRVDYALR